MVGLPSSRFLLRDDGWRYPVLVGLASIPFTAYAALPSLERLSPPVIAVGFVAAFLYDGRGDVGSFAVGGRAGIVAVLPVTWWVVEAVRMVATTGGPLWFQTVAVVAVAGAVFPVSAGLAYVLGGVAGKVGAWLAARTVARRPAAPAS